jgi:hypothetical protein
VQSRIESDPISSVSSDRIEVQSAGIEFVVIGTIGRFWQKLGLAETVGRLGGRSVRGLRPNLFVLMDHWHAGLAIAQCICLEQGLNSLL